MISVGESLRRERLRRNLELDQVSQELKISARFLEAIEQEKFDRLPAAVFAKSFVRQYAHLLELDEDELAAEVQRAIQPQSAAGPAAQSSEPMPDIRVPPVTSWEDGIIPERRFSMSSSLPSLALVVLVMLFCSGVYSVWQRSRRPAVHQPAAAATARPPQPALQPPPEGKAPVETAQPAPATAPEPAPAAPVEQRASADREKAAVAAAPVTAQNPAAAGTMRIELNAQEPVWVLAQNDGKYLFSGTLDTNETRTIDANGTVTLRLGNAGGINITLNGKPIGSVGPRGQVRTVQFTSGGFHIVAPKPSLPPEERI